ncbi:hypothetical protein D3C86_775560 [compost metagenome]
MMVYIPIIMAKVIEVFVGFYITFYWQVNWSLHIFSLKSVTGVYILKFNPWPSSIRIINLNKI